MTAGTIDVVYHSGVAQIFLKRPAKRNALDRPMLEATVAALKAFDKDSCIRAIVISGDPCAFAAGADIGSLAEVSAIELYQSGFSELWDEVAIIKKPIIAAVSGYALGGGFELALICDIVVCTRDAIFGLPETGIGTIPGAGGTQRLVRAVGKSMAMEMILSGRRLNAEEAVRSGIASSMVEPEELEATAIKIARRICAASPVALELAKRAVLQSFETSLSAGVKYERSLSALIAASDDRAEGMKAFAEKRTPDFGGR